MGYRCIAYTPWMADILRDRYGLEARWFECGTDLDVFAFARPRRAAREELIAVYARRETERRAVDLAMAGLARARRAAADDPARAVRLAPEGRAAVRGRGPRRRARRGGSRELYREAPAGIVFSLTTHSLVAHEMMASGLPVVELEGDNVGSALGAVRRRWSSSRRGARTRSPTRVERLLDDREAAAAMARRARAFVEARDWERAGDQVESALREFLASPRISLDPRSSVDGSAPWASQSR